ncbi:MAG: DUF4446 family protein [Candidatus Pacebacteria bacterium]|nr:DUF4446 family protein [Candidatus Paceibacterota bacterium]
MFNFLKKKKEPENIAQVLSYLKKLDEENNRLKKEIEKIKEESFYFIKKMDVIRYNPFSTIGGNQSFSVIFLNKNNDGAIITGLYAEGGSRVYAKPIEKGNSKYSLSKEEEQLLRETTDKK